LKDILPIIWRLDLLEVILQVTFICILEEYMSCIAMCIASMVSDYMGGILESLECGHFGFVALFGIFRGIRLENEGVGILGA
jgi:hypothetical protein